jgi:hypothetical protein
MVLELTQPLTQMSTRYLPGSKALPVRKADSLTAMRELIVGKMWGALTFHVPMGFHGMLWG